MSEETIPAMREQLDAQAKEIKDLRADNQKLSSEIRVRDAREAFRVAGYNPKHGDLFARETPEGDITAEAVTEFAGKWDLAPASSGDDADIQDGGSDTSGDNDGTDTLSSMDRSGTRGGEGGGGSSTEQQLTRQEWIELQGTDPVAAQQALNQGRVLLSASGNVRAGQAVRGGSNPYEPVPVDS